MEALLDALFSMQSPPYQRKIGDQFTFTFIFISGSNHFPVGMDIKHVTYSIFFLELCVLHNIYLPIDLHHQHRPTADVSHLISVPSDFPGPS
jgi:hypothetical protein